MGQMGCRSGDSLRLAALWNYLCCGSSDGAGLFRTVRPSGQNLLVCLFGVGGSLYLYCQCAPDALLDGALAESGVVVVGGVCARIGACGQIFSSPME